MRSLIRTSKSEMAEEVETFLKYVLERSKEINGGLPHERRGNCDNLLNELLLHVDLLGKTVQFLHEIGNISSLDQQEKVKWKDLENVYSEVEKMKYFQGVLWRSASGADREVIGQIQLPAPAALEEQLLSLQAPRLQTDDKHIVALQRLGKDEYNLLNLVTCFNDFDPVELVEYSVDAPDLSSDVLSPEYQEGVPVVKVKGSLLSAT